MSEITVTGWYVVVGDTRKGPYATMEEAYLAGRLPEEVRRY